MSEVFLLVDLETHTLLPELYLNYADAQKSLEEKDLDRKQGFIIKLNAEAVSRINNRKKGENNG